MSRFYALSRGFCFCLYNKYHHVIIAERATQKMMLFLNISVLFSSENIQISSGANTVSATVVK